MKASWSPNERAVWFLNETLLSYRAVRLSCRSPIVPFAYRAEFAARGWLPGQLRERQKSLQKRSFLPAVEKRLIKPP